MANHQITDFTGGITHLAGGDAPEIITQHFDHGAFHQRGGFGAPTFFVGEHMHWGQDRLWMVAEDLGIITPEVDALRARYGLPGMKILQFAFGDVHSIFFGQRLGHSQGTPPRNDRRVLPLTRKVPSQRQVPPWAQSNSITSVF